MELGLGDKNLRRADDSLEASVTGSLDSESSTGEPLVFFFLFFSLPLRVADCATMEVESISKSGIRAFDIACKGYLLAHSPVVVVAD